MNETREAMSKNMNQSDAERREAAAMHDEEQQQRSGAAETEERDAQSQAADGSSSQARESRAAEADGSGEVTDEALRAQVEEANRRALLAQAELENFRKRTRRDHEEQLKFAIIPLAKDLLEVVDNLNRALESGGDDISGLRSGVEMVRSQLVSTLEKHGIRAIPTVGELFDPNYHEAIGQMPSDEHPEGVVAHQALPGYQLHDRVIRPPQVLISAGPAKDAQQ